MGKYKVICLHQPVVKVRRSARERCSGTCMYAEVSSGAVRERGEEQGCKYAGDNEQKGHEKMTMTKKRHKNFPEKVTNDMCNVCIHNV